MRLAWDTFLLFEAPDYSMEGINAFKTFINDPILKQMFTEGRYRTLAAFQNGLMIGFLGVRNKRGIAAALLKRMFAMTYKEYGKMEMTVNSSPYAVDFYHRIGFTDTDFVQTTDGITYTPMIIRF